MKKIVALGLIVVMSAGWLIAANSAGTDVILQQALSDTGSDEKAFKSIMGGVNRYGDLATFRDLVYAVGLQFPLRGYGKKKPKAKKAKAFLELIPRGQKITVLAPMGSALLPLVGSLKKAKESHDKAAIAAAKANILDVLKAHIIKGELRKADLKGMLTSIGGKLINADNLAFYKTDIKAENGVLHIVKHLATDESHVMKIATAPVAAQAAAAAPAADAKQAAPTDSATDAKSAPAADAKPAETSTAPATTADASTATPAA